MEASSTDVEHIIGDAKQISFTTCLHTSFYFLVMLLLSLKPDYAKPADPDSITNVILKSHDERVT